MAELPAERLKIVWSWKCNADPFDKKQIADWKRSSDLQIDFIEEKYQNKEKYVELGEYTIDFKKMVQYRKDDPNRQRPVRREGIDVRQYLREDRDCTAEKPASISKSFGEPCEFFENTKIIDGWKKKYQNLCGSQDYSKIVDQAAKEIIDEGHLMKKEVDAQLISRKLLKVKHETQSKTHYCCVYIYSMQSFLYDLVNTTMRNADFSKVDTLGASCYLLALNRYDNNKEDSILYRGCKLADEMVDDYKNAVGRQIIWSSFTSLSRSLIEAEKFVKNALFIIRLTGNAYCSKDIANLSEYSYEEEVLLQPVHPMWVIKFDYDKDKKIYVIHLNDDPDY